jgi:outer membrane immunogenic protein
MKKHILFITSFVFAVTFAQSPLETGKLQLNAGLGLSTWGTPVYLGLDYGIAKDFTIGIEGSYRSYSQSYFNDKYSSSIIGIGANGNYHFNRVLDIPSKFDFYAGLGLGYYIWNTNYNNSFFTPANVSGLGLGGQVGGRYFFNKSFGINLELGGGSTTSGAKFGITYKFGGGSSSGKRYSESKPASKSSSKPSSKPTAKKKKK